MPDANEKFSSFPESNAFRHALALDGRESLTHQVVMPEHGIAGFIYPTVRGDGSGKARFFLFGPALERPIEEQVDGIMPVDMNFDDWRLGSIQMQVRKPFQTVALKWTGERIQFEGLWEAIHPPYAFSSHPRGNPPHYGDDRTEQHGIVKGLLTIDGKDYAMDHFMIRDHSWGPRVWGLNQHYKWFHVTTQSVSVHFFEMLCFGRVELRGYLFKDGVMHHIETVDYDIDYDAEMMQKGFRVTVKDEAGRSVFVDCKSYANYQLDLDPEVLLNEAILEAKIGGEDGTGWLEFCWSRAYLAYAKPFVGRFA
ncbi:hypothetical protein HZF05_15660 [Sphingomonas sp. CGMCC 1.13654]|uniref:Uncharacterized protein n=1 Tax=Sphingomonas chungangi TaxID=2683589 RepID=A0A838L7Q7_9SPHN|nr:hypothetical protein [Sphingomonas chungangi]MBA2935523.1 hypothetical protein [Sphingomonas chungangi]MVW57030.1 hypothetical protein [Sphingomonas chungangi]